MNIIQLPRDSDGLAFPPGAKALPSNPELPRPITRGDREALSHCLDAFDQVARSYFALAQLFPQSAAREALLGDIALARAVIHKASTNMGVEAVSACDKPALARSYLSVVASGSPHERNARRGGHENASPNTSSLRSRLRIPRFSE